MRVASPETHRWAAELAARLRLLQSSFADDPPETREQILNEELDQALKAVPIGKRKDCIEALADEFPAPELDELAGKVGELPEPPDDPAVLVERLLNLARSMAPEESEAIFRPIQDSGLLPETRAGNLEVPEELRKRMEKLAPGKSLDVGRALRLLDILIEVTGNLDQLVWQVWKNIAAKSVIQRETGAYSDFRKTLAPYLSGDPELSTDQVKQIVNKTRKLVSGLMAAMGTVGEINASKYLDRLSPDAIRKIAEADSGVFESLEKKCWRKYTGIFQSLNRATMEREVLDAIRKYTEKLVLGADVANTLED
ncbi:MAG TPA: hypothetical protein VIS96_18755 [Terrimicrobiaceae bacterium]